MTNAKPAFCIILRAEIDGDFAHVNGSVGILSDTEENGFDYAYSQGGVAQVRIRSQANRTNDSGLYGWSFGYDAPYYHVDLYTAKRMLETLRPIEARMEKARLLEGDARTFGAWINRLARAIGAKTVFIKRERCVNGSAYTRCDLAHTPIYVDHMVSELLAKLNPKPVTA